MHNLSKDDLRLLICALRDAVSYNKLIAGDTMSGEDDREECRIALVDYNSVYGRVRQVYEEMR
jgi:hypothetical protein